MRVEGNKLRDLMELESQQVRQRILEPIDDALLEGEIKFRGVHSNGDFPQVHRSQLPEFAKRMFAGDFLFGVPRQFLASCKIPMLLMPGDDDMHPVEVSYEMVQLAPHTEVAAPWKGNKFRHEAIELTRDFFIRNTPKMTGPVLAP